jgi:hypothetical protein
MELLYFAYASNMLSRRSRAGCFRQSQLRGLRRVNPFHVGTAKGRKFQWTIPRLGLRPHRAASWLPQKRASSA